MGQEVRLCRLQIFVFMFLVFVFVFVVWFGKWCSSASQLWPFFVCLFVCVISSESGLYQYVPKYKHRFIQYYYTNRYIYIYFKGRLVPGFRQDDGQYTAVYDKKNRAHSNPHRNPNLHPDPNPTSYDGSSPLRFVHSSVRKPFFGNTWQAIVLQYVR